MGIDSATLRDWIGRKAISAERLDPVPGRLLAATHTQASVTRQAPLT
jgi:hydroxyacyl-ACP dehydratase HTD2-like protein with hotdog domain